MNEIPRIPWHKVVSNFVWIAGAAIILAAVARFAAFGLRVDIYILLCIIL